MKLKLSISQFCSVPLAFKACKRLAPKYVQIVSLTIYLQEVSTLLLSIFHVPYYILESYGKCAFPVAETVLWN